MAREITPHPLPPGAVEAMCDMSNKLLQYTQEMPMLRGDIGRNTDKLSTAVDAINANTQKQAEVIVAFKDEMEALRTMLADHLDRLEAIVAKVAK